MVDPYCSWDWPWICFLLLPLDLDCTLEQDCLPIGFGLTVCSLFLFLFLFFLYSIYSLNIYLVFLFNPFVARLSLLILNSFRGKFGLGMSAVVLVAPLFFPPYYLSDETLIETAGFGI